MLYHFIFQYRSLTRTLGSTGLNPHVAFVFLGITFVGLGSLLFERTDHADLILILVAGLFIHGLNEEKRCDHLRILFTPKDYRLLRITENLLASLPFVLLLILHERYLYAALLPIAAWLLSVRMFQHRAIHTIPTPFSKRPYEFVTGFRSTYLLVFAGYLLCAIAVHVDNFNLGVFSLIALGALSLYYYSEAEPKYFVWIYAFTPHKFLLLKVTTALIHITIITAPVLLLLYIVYPAFAHIVAVFHALIFAYMITMILAKYSAYPMHVGIPEIVVIGVSIYLPPALVLIIPYFYTRALQRLNMIL